MAATGFNLRSSTRQTYHSFKFINEGSIFSTYGVMTSGDLIAIGDTVGVVIEDVLEGEEGTLVYKANNLDIPCISDDYLLGTRVYWDAATRKVTLDDSSGQHLLGVVVKAASPSDATVEIDLDGTGLVVS